MKRQAVIRQPLRQHAEDSPCIPFFLEDDDQIICIADENCTTGKSRYDLPCEPLIKHLVQLDVRQDWGDYPTLRRAGLRVRDRPGFRQRQR